MKSTTFEILKLSILTGICVGVFIFHDDGIGFLLCLVCGFAMIYIFIDWLRLLFAYCKWADSDRSKPFEYKTDFTSAKSFVENSRTGDYPSSRLNAAEEQQLRTIVKYVQREIKK